MTAPDHPFDRDLTDVRLAQHLGAAHSYHSSSDLENFDATHRRLHGVPSASEERRQADLARAWAEGYAAGDRDAYHSSKARAWNGRTHNPYLTEAEPVDIDLIDKAKQMLPLTEHPENSSYHNALARAQRVQTNPDLWRN